MKEKLEALIQCAHDEMEIADKIVDNAMKDLRTMADAPEGHPVYDAISKAAYLHDYCQGRISAFKQVIAMLGENNEH